MPPCDTASDTASRGQPWHQEVEVGLVIPEGPETKFPGGEYRWEGAGGSCTEPSHQLGAAEGSKWMPGQLPLLPEES